MGTNGGQTTKNGHHPANFSLLDRVLDGKSSDFKAKVLEVALKFGVETNDPLFVVLLATGSLEALLEKKPQELNDLFAQWSVEIKQELDRSSKEALLKQEAAIASSVKSLIRQTQIQQQQQSWWTYLQAGVVFLGAVGIGVLLGLSVPVWLEGGLTASRKLTVAQAETLRWATSSEGKFARSIMDWNRDYLGDRSCLKDAEKLKVTLAVNGKVARKGFCLIWVVPPNQRKLVK